MILIMFAFKNINISSVFFKNLNQIKKTKDALKFNFKAYTTNIIKYKLKLNNG